MKRTHPLPGRRSTLPTVSLVGLATAALFIGCAQAQSKVTGPITGYEANALATGNTTEGSNSSGARFQTYHPDREHAVMRYTESDGSTSIVKSTRVADEKGVCHTWERKDWGTQCYRFEREGEKVKYLNLTNPTDVGSFTVVKGNPYNLGAR